MATLTRCSICDEPCLASVGICSDCLRHMGDRIKLLVVAWIILSVAVVVWILLGVYG